MKVAVYGTLREGCINHARLIGSNFIGTFESEPFYSMVSISDAYPALKQEGNTSITMEVYDINKDTLKDIDDLENYFGKDNHSNLYNRTIIKTPYGRAFLYIYNRNIVKQHRLIQDGDWVRFLQRNNLKQYA